MNHVSKLLRQHSAIESSSVGCRRSPAGPLPESTDGPSAGDQLEQDDAQRVDVAPYRGRLAAHLLWARIGRRHDADTRAIVVSDCTSPGIGVQQFRDAEIQQFRRAVLLHQDVAGLEIAMHDHAPVRIVHGRTAPSEIYRAGRCKGSDRRLAILGERLAFHVLHHEVRHAVRRGAAVDQPRDVRVFEMREYLPLVAEALDEEIASSPPRISLIATRFSNSLSARTAR